MITKTRKLAGTACQLFLCLFCIHSYFRVTMGVLHGHPYDYNDSPDGSPAYVLTVTEKLVHMVGNNCCRCELVSLVNAVFRHSRIPTVKTNVIHL